MKVKGKVLVIPNNSSNISPVLNDNSWEIISRISQAGTGDQYWDVGDCKEIILNGKIGNYLTLTDYKTYVFILDFNHKIDKTTTDNNIIWGGFKTNFIDGIDIALCDSGYNTNKTSGKYYTPNHVRVNTTVYSTNYGGWAGCDFRYDILGATSTQPSYYNTNSKAVDTVGYNATQTTITTPVANTLIAALPSDFKSVLKLWTRYTDNVGNKTNVEENISAIIDAGVSLLTEFEVFGTRSRANSYEQNYQTQMSYYANGNDKRKFTHTNYENDCGWWLASPYYNTVYGFCYGSPMGTIGYVTTHRDLALAPAFKT